MSDSIIHLIPVDDVREALVDEDRLHSVYADILDLMVQHLDNVGGGGPSTYTLLATGDLSNIRTGFSFKAAMVLAMRAAWNTSHHFELRFKLSTGAVRDTRDSDNSPAVAVYCNPSLRRDCDQ